MKRIGLISDTHSWLDPRVRVHFESCDEIWHAGDIGNLDVLNELAAMKPLRAVWGNIDGTNIRQRTEEFLWFDCEGMQVLITHIAGRPKHWSKPVLPWLTRKPDLLVCGHSHICALMRSEKEPLIYANPGAAGRHGFHPVRTIMRLELDYGKITSGEVIELGPRSERTQLG